MKQTAALFLLLCCYVVSFGQARGSLSADTISIRAGEKWYGAAVDEGSKMPFSDGYALKLYANCKGNQAAPLLLSSRGRYLWSEESFTFKIEDNKLIISDLLQPLIIGDSGTTLAQAYKMASHRFFPSSGKSPDPLFIDHPQYNTWIELKYDQNQEAILDYARDIIKNGMPPGILMIDDNWFPYYGKFVFRRDRFEDPVKMIAELHKMGFKVMLWVSPFISPDTEVSRELSRRGLLVSMAPDEKGPSDHTNRKPAIIEWWNGYSASIDLTNPDAVKWFRDQLDSMKVNYAVDGFKFDAGDPEFYADPRFVFHQKVTPNYFTQLWGGFGIDNPFNEYRAMWKMGNQPLVQRLRDKAHTWEDLQRIVPAMTVAGLLGYGFTCPDMIGGGEFSSFGNEEKINQKLIVRSAQVHALMPMMQFSIAPWRVLNPEALDAVKKAIGIRKHFLPVIKSLAGQYQQTGEPIVRSLEYVFPNQGFTGCNDQFMLGDSILVAPVLTESDSRTVKFPKGRWKSFDQKIIRGPATIKMDVPEDQLPWFIYSGK